MHACAMNELLQCGESVHGVLTVDRYKFNPNHVIPFEHEETAILKGNSPCQQQATKQPSQNPIKPLKTTRKP